MAASRPRPPQVVLHRIKLAPVPPKKKVTKGGNIAPSRELNVEDAASQFYVGGGVKEQLELIVPPYRLEFLAQLPEYNSALGPCIAAMVANVDATGYDIVPKPEVLKKWQDEKRKTLEAQAQKDAQTEAAQHADLMAAHPELNPVHPDNPFHPLNPLNPDSPANPDNQKPDGKKVLPFGRSKAAPPPPPKLPPGITAKPKPIDERELSLEKYKEEHYDEMQPLRGFFEQPFPGETFVQQRKQFREDREATGTGYFELIENENDELIFMRPLRSHTMRLVKLDEPIMADVEIKRAGETVTLKMPRRERRFAQVVNNQISYFRELNSSREVDAKTGLWLEKVAPETETKQLPTKPKKVSRKKQAPPEEPPMLGRSVIWSKVTSHAATNYGVPRWVGQLLSVTGARAAEEFNNSVFDRAGVPPMMILIHGGTVDSKLVKELNALLNSGGLRHEIPVLSATPAATGGLDDPVGKVSITVERFSSESAKDAMFGTYDKDCTAKVRGAFRLSGIFFGEVSQTAFASAYAAITVAESQVFKPERDDFDAMISLNVLPMLPEGENYLFKTNPVSLHDVQLQIQAISGSQDVIAGEERVRQFNNIVGLDMVAKTDDASPMNDPQMQKLIGHAVLNLPGTGGPPKPGSASNRAKREFPLRAQIALVDEVAEAFEVAQENPDRFVEAMKRVEALPEGAIEEFKYHLAERFFGPDRAGDPIAAELAGCAAGMLSYHLRTHGK